MWFVHRKNYFEFSIFGLYGLYAMLKFNIHLGRKTLPQKYSVGKHCTVNEMKLLISAVTLFVSFRFYFCTAFSLRKFKIHFVWIIIFAAKHLCAIFPIEIEHNTCSSSYAATNREFSCYQLPDRDSFMVFDAYKICFEWKSTWSRDKRWEKVKREQF